MKDAGIRDIGSGGCAYPLLCTPRSPTQEVSNASTAAQGVPSIYIVFRRLSAATSSQPKSNHSEAGADCAEPLPGPTRSVVPSSRPCLMALRLVMPRPFGCAESSECMSGRPSALQVRLRPPGRSRRRQRNPLAGPGRFIGGRDDLHVLQPLGPAGMGEPVLQHA